MRHVDDFLDAGDAPVFVLQFLEHARRPAMYQDKRWLAANAPWVEWRGKVFRCVGASRLGDVWLKDSNDGQPNAFYTHRVDVAELTDWRSAP